MDEDIFETLTVDELVILGEVLSDSIDVEKEMKGEEYGS